MRFHQHYLALVEEIERSFPVERWRWRDVDIWPLARMDLYLDLYWANAGRSPPPPRPFVLRAAARAATPLTNWWKSRRDLDHRIVRPHGAHAIFLGDGVSLDRVNRGWQDRFGEPVIEALERRGLRTFLMQGGYLARLPWVRPTFSANLVEARGFLRAFGRGAATLPEHASVVSLLARDGLRAPALDPERLTQRARLVCATASAFESVLLAVRPKLAFVVTFYAGLGAPFLLACRRQGILSVDLQHCPQERAHKAYRWSSVPESGYTTLPAVFWNWTERDSADIRQWTERLSQPWHRAVFGGHTQLAPFFDAAHVSTKAWDDKFRAVGHTKSFEREILVALQPVHGQRALWEALAAEIEAAPSSWRWWIRRHPAQASIQDEEFGRLLALRKPNVVIDAASLLPLPALLRHMSALISSASGAALEASLFGVPAFFLSDAAHDTFSGLISRGHARVIDVRSVREAVANVPSASARPARPAQPEIAGTLLELEELAESYSGLCRAKHGSNA